MMEIIIAIAMIMGAFCYYQNNKIVITNLKVKSRINKSRRPQPPQQGPPRGGPTTPVLTGEGAREGDRQAGPGQGQKRVMARGGSCRGIGVGLRLTFKLNVYPRH